MSYLQKGHVEQSFYQRSTKSYLATDNNSFLAADNKSFLNSSNDTFLTSSSDSFLAGNLTDKSYLNSSNTSFLDINKSSSHIEPTNKSFVEKSATSYLSLVKPSANNKFLELNHQKHVDEVQARHLDEDQQNHLQESGGETSDEEREDFSHAVDWSLVVPPYISPLFSNGLTKYRCSLTNRIHDTMPSIPERFDVFDFDIQQLIETISRYHAKGANGSQKYRELMSQKKDLHSTELQSQALEALRVWKHKKEQEMLGQVNIEAADFSERTDRMGVGDVSSGGAADRKKRRDALKKRQEKERQQQMALKQRLKQEQHVKSQEELVRQKQDTQQRQRQQQQAMERKREQQRQEEMQRKQRRDQQAGERDHYVKVQSRNATQQRQQSNVAAMNRNMSSRRDEDMGRKQQRAREHEEKQNYVKGQQQMSSQRKQDRRNNMQSGLEEKLDSQASFRANISQQRSNRVQQQSDAQKNAAQAMSNKRAEKDAERKREEAERLRKAAIKTFVSRINGLLAVKSAGIDFDEFGNEFFFKYNAEWDPEGIMGISDLDDVFKAQGLSSTVQVIKGGMTKRAILYKHYQKIKIVSNDVNDILTVLAISDDIDSAIKRLRRMVNQREAEREREKQRVKQKETAEKQRRLDAERRKRMAPAKPTPTAGSGRQVDYSQRNNWGLPRGTRARKTAQGRLFYVNDNTKTTSWEDPRPLPRGWRGGKTPQGRKFYINDATKTTSWNDPRPPIRI